MLVIFTIRRLYSAISLEIINDEQAGVGVKVDVGEGVVVSVGIGLVGGGNVIVTSGVDVWVVLMVRFGVMVS